MRNVLCKALVEQAAASRFVFLTGDLGYDALEPLRDAMGPRFINAGVAEQNMVSVAAGLAVTGWSSWVYSIASFLYSRPFEQIRNDVCQHDLPVKIAGNGGGYAYGVMGGTHHALEDYGVLLSLPNMRAFIPAFAGDVGPIARGLMTFRHPSYLRLGRCEKPKDFDVPPYAPWRRLLRGGGPTMVVVGPLVGGIVAALRPLPEDRRPDLWVLTELPLDKRSVPTEFLDDLRGSRHLFVVEEHVAQGGAGQQLPHLLLTMGEMPPRFTHRCALGYVSGLYGSQAFHRKECGLDAASIVAELGGGA
ncbi:MAG: transketolase family protein [Elusimicrobiota bacterium]